MDIPQNFKKIFRIGSILISIIELLVIAVIFPKYEGIISYGFFIILILFQPIWYFNLTKINSKINSSKKFISVTLTLVIISISIPILIYTSIPKYTYNDGLTVLKNHLQKDKNNEFLVDNTFKGTITITEFHRKFPKNLLIDNKFYLYLAVSDDNSKNFALNPLTGEVLEINENLIN